MTHCEDTFDINFEKNKKRYENQINLTKTTLKHFLMMINIIFYKLKWDISDDDIFLFKVLIFFLIQNHRKQMSRSIFMFITTARWRDDDIHSLPLIAMMAELMPEQLRNVPCRVPF